jgi:hypothetical protein
MRASACRARAGALIARHALSPTLATPVIASCVASLAPWIEIEIDTTRPASSSASSSEIGKPFEVIVTSWPSSFA